MANFKEFVATGEEPVGKYMEFSVEVLPDGITSAIPDGWEICNGAEISRQDYADLFDIIGTTFGSGNGSDTFNLPDFRGKFLRGHGGNSNPIGVPQSDSFKSHQHSGSSVTTTNSDHSHSISGGSHSHSTNAEKIEGGSGVAAGGQWFQNLGTNDRFRQESAGVGTGGSSHSHSVSGGSHTHGLSIVSDGDNETRPINMAAVICIKV